MTDNVVPIRRGGKVVRLEDPDRSLSDPKDPVGRHLRGLRDHVNVEPIPKGDE